MNKKSSIKIETKNIFYIPILLLFFFQKIIQYVINIIIIILENIEQVV